MPPGGCVPPVRQRMSRRSALSGLVFGPRAILPAPTRSALVMPVLPKMILVDPDRRVHVLDLAEVAYLEDGAFLRHRSIES